MTVPMSVADSLAAERGRVAQQVADLSADLQAIIDASSDANADDEHDPEGSTIGFERAQVASLLDRARARLVDLDRAEERLRTGTYGICQRCRGPIGGDRLAALPTAAVCVRCATGATGRRG
jgi:RNA polymerase-binding transcription factor DksA